MPLYLRNRTSGYICLASVNPPTRLREIPGCRVTFPSGLKRGYQNIAIASSRWVGVPSTWLCLDNAFAGDDPRLAALVLPSVLVKKADLLNSC